MHAGKLEMLLNLAFGRGEVRELTIVEEILWNCQENLFIVNFTFANTGTNS